MKQCVWKSTISCYITRNEFCQKSTTTKITTMTVCSQWSVCKTRPPLVAVAVTDKQCRSHNTHNLKPWKIYRRAKRKLTTPSKTEQVTSDIKKTRYQDHQLLNWVIFKEIIKKGHLTNFWCFWQCGQVPNSLTRLCVVALDALTPATIHSLWSSPKFLNRFCLTILIRLQFSLLCIFFFHTFSFHSTFCWHAWIKHSVNSQLLWQWMFVAYPPCEGCQWLSYGQLSDQQSSPWLCSLVNQTERPFWRLRKTLQVFWVD